jgi:outer membrane protein insertion porin family
MLTVRLTAMKSIFLRAFAGFVLPCLALACASELAYAQVSQHRGRPSAGSQQQAPLVAVHAKGTQRYNEAEIAAASGLKIGATVGPQDFKTAADELVASGAFDEVSYRYEPAGTGYAVTFQLVDSDQFLPVSYDNFVWFTDQQLTDAIHQRVPLFKGEVSVANGMVEKVTEALQGVLAEKGIPGTVQFMQEGSFGQGKVDGKINGGVFTIAGLEIAVREVTFPGAAQSDLPELQKTAESLLKIPYERSLVAAFAENNLRPLYAKRGYLKATFSKPGLKVLNDDVKSPQVAVSIGVDPGPQYRIAEMQWSGNKAFWPEDLQALLTVKPGAVADALQIDSDLDKVRSLYGSKGYIHANVTAHPTFDDSQHTASYEFVVNEGDVYHLGDVTITARGFSQDLLARLREAWQMRQGEPYDATYERKYMKDVRPMLTPNVTVEVNKDVNEDSKTVDVSMTFVVHADKVIREKSR